MKTLTKEDVDFLIEEAQQTPHPHYVIAGVVLVCEKLEIDTTNLIENLKNSKHRLVDYFTVTDVIELIKNTLEATKKIKK